MGTPDLIVIGHLTRDLLEDGTSRLGGTAAYAALAAARLGLRVGVYTAGRPDMDLNPLPDAGIEVQMERSAQETLFCNRYRRGRRSQFLLSRATPLDPAGLPPAWKKAPAALLGPVARELPAAWRAAFFPGTFLAACLQGWLRTWDETGRVRPAPWEEAEEWLPHLRVAFVSEEDLGGDRATAARYVALCPLLLLTLGPRGALLYRRGQPLPVAPFPAREVDPTGAGDIFAAALVVRLIEGASPEEAARFAAAAAALSVQGGGLAAVPDRAAVLARLEERDVVPAP